jgi:chromodomain-helicase-DNA-binding protein 4
MRGGICMGCMETALEPDHSQINSSRLAINDAGDGDVIMEDAEKSLSPVYTLARELLFRCFTCKRLAHYSHLPTPPMLEPDCSVVDIAKHYQQMKSWLCADCSSFKYGVDKILAWRLYPANAVEPTTDPEGIPNYKAQLPREYLIKWSGRSYRRVQWVPHMWLVSTNPSRLKNFISGGSKVELLSEPAVDQDATEVDAGLVPLFENEPESRGGSVRASDDTVKTWLSALPDAERRIPLPWKSVDRVLDIVLWRPEELKQKELKQASHRRGRGIISEDEEEDSSNEDNERIRFSNLIFDQGEEPPAHLTETVKEWETHGTLKKSDIDHVVWAFIKWEELGYDEGKTPFGSYP